MLEKRKGGREGFCRTMGKAALSEVRFTIVQCACPKKIKNIKYYHNRPGNILNSAIYFHCAAMEQSAKIHFQEELYGPLRVA
jgi:hypothetical protein